jgi:hypothetical protein
MFPTTNAVELPKPSSLPPCCLGARTSGVESTSTTDGGRRSWTGITVMSHPTLARATRAHPSSSTGTLAERVAAPLQRVGPDEHLEVGAPCIRLGGRAQPADTPRPADPLRWRFR